MFRDHRHIVWGSLLAASLIISVVIYAVSPQKLVPTVLFFPSANNHGIQSEVHFLPRSADALARTHDLVESAIAGPLSLKYKRLAPPATRILGVFTNGKKVWVNLSPEFQFPADDCPLSPRARAALLTRAFNYNDHAGLTFAILINGKEIADNYPVVGRKS